jgi:hypothetical protein
MADQATVKVDIAKRTFEVSGSEQFITKMLDQIPLLFPERDDTDVAEEPEQGLSSGGRIPSTYTNLAEFVAKKGVTRQTSHERTTAAFIYYLTKVKGSATCTADDVIECYEEAGLPLPPNLNSTLNNLKNRSKFVKSPGRGQYALTIPGQNMVTQRMGGGD